LGDEPIKLVHYKNKQNQRTSFGGTHLINENHNRSWWLTNKQPSLTNRCTNYFLFMAELGYQLGLYGGCKNFK
jgi:hypothetical protein